MALIVVFANSHHVRTLPSSLSCVSAGLKIGRFNVPPAPPPSLLSVLGCHFTTAPKYLHSFGDASRPSGSQVLRAVCRVATAHVTGGSLEAPSLPRPRLSHSGIFSHTPVSALTLRCRLRTCWLSRSCVVRARNCLPKRSGTLQHGTQNMPKSLGLAAEGTAVSKMPLLAITPKTMASMSARDAKAALAETNDPKFGLRKEK